MEAKIPRTIFYRTAAALMLLLALTVGLSFVHLGPFSFFLSLLIGTAKAVLVILFFMEARYSNRLTWMVAGISVLWLLILLAGTLTDYYTRGPAVRAGRYNGSIEIQPRR